MKSEDIEKMNFNISQGVSLLDERLPDWYDHVDISKLYMGDKVFCILGQLYGDYFDGKDVLGIYSGAAYGFDTRFDSMWGHPDLGKRWVEIIKERRLASQ